MFQNLQAFGGDINTHNIPNGTLLYIGGQKVITASTSEWEVYNKWTETQTTTVTTTVTDTTVHQAPVNAAALQATENSLPNGTELYVHG